MSAPLSMWWARAIVLGSLLVASGCWSSNDTVRSSEPPPEPPPPPAPTPPTFDAFLIPPWPPLGPNGKVEVRLSDDEALSRITATFNGVSRKAVGGRTSTVSFIGSELGEGMGTLTLIACDERSACRQRQVSDLVIDLTPPEIELERPVVSSLVDGIDGQVAVWVTDGWVLGSLELTFAGKVVRRDFPQAYPSTLGVERDTSRVAFPAKDFPTGAGSAKIVARDAAGNERTQSVMLRIDGTRPIVGLVEPLPGAQVSGAMTVRVTATDESGVAPTIDVWVGGARVLTGVSTTTPLVIDTSALPAGATEVRVVATDEAGNESIAAKAAIEIMP